MAPLPPPFRPDDLREAFARALPLLDLLPDVLVYAKDRAHRFVLANEAEWRLHGCENEAGMLGRTDHDFHPPVLARQYVREDLQVMQTGESILHRIWLVSGADGSPFWYVSSKLPLRDRDGRMAGVAGVMRPYDQGGQAPDEYRRLLPAVEFARFHYGETLRTKDLAGKAGLSESQFQREFRRVFGMTPGQYLMQVRLQAARQLLSRTSQALSSIALDCGFHDQSHFTKQFKLATGLLPLAYRRQFAPRPGSTHAAVGDQPFASASPGPASPMFRALKASGSFPEKAAPFPEFRPRRESAKDRSGRRV